VKVTVCTITDRRPGMLGYMVHCFERQTHRDRQLIVLDDSGELAPARGDRWRIYSVDRPYPTLGAKRNACARLAPGDTDVLVIWDEDDLYLPWALEATVAAMNGAEWSRPSVVGVLTDSGKIRPIRSHSEFRNDKAYQCSWGINYKAFWEVGGYDEHLNQGEDAALALKLLSRDTPEADPILLGYPPWYVSKPHKNASDESTAKSGDEYGRRVESVEPALDLKHPSFLPGISPRPWQQNWYEEIPK